MEQHGGSAPTRIGGVLTNSEGEILLSFSELVGVKFQCSDHPSPSADARNFCKNSLQGTLLLRGIQRMHQVGKE